MRQPKSKNLGSRIAAALAVLLLASIFFSLGIWQLDRAAALKASLVTATLVDQNIVSLESIAAANTSLKPSALNRQVKVSGQYIAHFKAPNQKDAIGKLDDWEVALLQVGTNEGILVVRGLWSERRLNSDIQQSMVIDVVGQLHARQDGDRAVNSPGVISRLDSAVVVGITELDVFDGYIVAASESHNGDEFLRTRVSAEKLISRIPGFYWQHLSYVVIWWLMAGVVLYLPFYRRKVDL
ncbi:MAG: SURF1 family cytochrome oxidase biogenesis protein [Candidatus Planktophila sp.]|nr:SURF1 family cytochrome oxidase biogenesis protein [Candidatus Planktophila sp.]